jgi:helicase required for RNAi-mediated heterochromatin assembly 1
LKELKKHPGLRANTYFNVFTVDSYQGEENDIILLSLVRSNEFLDIGFLESRNRLVVAISRARRGLYIFGNAITLTAAETNGDVVGRDALWTPLIKFMKHQGRFDLDGGFPITCVTHGTTLEIKEADEWLGLAGGCHRDCDGILPCGHNCSLKCHPFDHSMAFCRVACPRKLECGHGCSHLCGETCGCSLCEEGSKIIDESHDHRQPMSDSGKQAPHMLASQCKSEPGGFYNPMPRQSSLGALEKWRNWDAKKGDSEMAEIRLIEASKKMTALSELVYEDTWRPVSIENGVRSLSGPERKIIRRFDNDNTSRSQVPKTSTMHNASVGITKPPEKRKVSNIVSRMTGFGVSNVDPFSKLSTPGRTSTQTGHLIDLELADPSEYAATPTHLGHEQTRYGLTVNLMDKLTAIHSKFGSSRRVTPAVIPPIKASYLEAAQEEEDLIDLSDSGPPILGSSAPDFDPSAVIDGMLWTDDDYD